MAKQNKPSGLNPEGSALWASITDTYDLRADELHTLESACRATDRIVTMRTVLDQSHMMVKGSMGQDVVHPLVAEVRAHEAQVAGLLAKLKLPDDGTASSSEGEKSTKARAAANARWQTGGA